MMSRVLKILVLFCICHIEIHVKAEVIEVPESCWEAGGECALKASAFHKIKSSYAAISLEKETLLKRNMSGSFSLVDGEAFVSAESEDVFFELPQGKLVVSKGAKAQIKRLDSGIRIGLLAGVARMHPHGNSEVLMVPAGYTMTFEWVNSTGQVVVDIPRSLSQSEWVSLFYSFYQDLKPQELRAQFEKDFVVWRRAIESATHMQHDIASRALAKAEAEKQRRAKLKVQREEEDRKLRELFRQKNYF